MTQNIKSNPLIGVKTNRSNNQRTKFSFSEQLERGLCKVLVINELKDMNANHVYDNTYGISEKRAMNEVALFIKEITAQAFVSQNTFVWNGYEGTRELFPRNMEWTNLPIAGGPFYQVGACEIMAPISNGVNVHYEYNSLTQQTWRNHEVLEFIKEVETVVFLRCKDRGPEDKADLNKQFTAFAELFVLADRKNLPKCFTYKLDFTQTDLASNEFESTKSVACAVENIEQARASKRFLWNYKVNFKPLVERALLASEKIVFLFQTTKKTALLTSEDWDVLSDPMTMLVLFSIKKDIHPKLQTDYVNGFGPFRLDHYKFIEYLDKIMESGKDETDNNILPFNKIMFEGSGKYEPVEVLHNLHQGLYRLNPRKTFIEQSEIPKNWEFLYPDSACNLYTRYKNIMYFLTQSGFVLDSLSQREIIVKAHAAARKAVKKQYIFSFEYHDKFKTLEKEFEEEVKNQINEHIREHGILTPGALYFLEHFPKEFDDPDILLRWRGKRGYPVESDIPAMDRWINKAFKALKKNINHLDSQGNSYQGTYAK